MSEMAADLHRARPHAGAFGFGLFARLNTTVLGTLSVGALSVAAAMYLILRLNRPFDGPMRVSEAPPRYALGRMSD